MTKANGIGFGLVEPAARSYPVGGSGNWKRATTIRGVEPDDFTPESERHIDPDG